MGSRVRLRLPKPHIRQHIKTRIHSGIHKRDSLHSDGLFHKPTYALGGVSAENIQLVSDLGFAGAAVLGSLWQAVPFTTDNIVSRLRELQGI